MPEPLDGRDATVDLQPLRVPERVDLDGDRLVWAFERVPMRAAVRVPRDLLGRFLALRWPDGSRLIPPAVRDRWRPHSSPATLEVKRKRFPTAIVSHYESVDQDRVAEGRERVVDFAKRYGVLAICHHGLPTTHAYAVGPPVWAVRQAYPQVTACLPLGAMDDGFQSRMGFEPHEGGDKGLAGWEPVHYWRSTASLLYSVVSIADHYDRERPAPAAAIGDISVWPPRILPDDPVDRAEALTGERRHVPEYLPPSLSSELRRRGEAVWPYAISPRADWDWSTLEALYRERYGRAIAEPAAESGAPSHTRTSWSTWSTSIEAGRLRLDWYVNGLLALARPHLVHSGSPPSTSLAADGLFGALVLQLLLRVHGSKGFVVCSGCSQIFIPLRRRSARSAAYCPDCRGTRDNADRQARWRARHHGDQPEDPQRGTDDLDRR